MTSTKRKLDRPTVYPSEIDLWIAVLLMVSPLITLGLGLYVLLDGNTRDAAILFATAALVTLVSAVFTLPCRYTIEEDLLRVRCGIIGFKIPLAEIERIEKSRSWLSGPALSIKRVAVATSRRTVLVSPVNRDEFIVDLEHAVSDSKQRDESD